MTSSAAVVYVVAALVSIIMAFLLVYFTELSIRARMDADRKRKGRSAADETMFPDSSLKKTVYESLKGLTESKGRHKEIADAVSGIFARELDKRVSLEAKSLSEKYEGAIKEKAESEEVAWKKYKKVLSAKEETEAVIRSIAEGLVVIDKNGKVIMMNPAAEKLLGVSKKDKVGKPILEGVKEEQLFSLAKGSREEEEKEIELISKHDDTKRVLRASTAVIENENGQTVGMVSVLSDITKQRELDQVKSNFVANVSHELRTPLVAIGKSLSLILDKTAGQLSQTQEQLLSVADRNLKRLTFLINDLLDLSKMEAGKTELRCEYASLGDVVHECVEGLSTWAGTKSIRIMQDIEAGLPKVFIDPNRITQVLNNLLGNSIKFTPTDGTIIVRVRMRKENLAVEISVQDTGVGINKENVTKVFDKFYQVGERVATDISGTGIGLSIAKEIVELHNGKIWAESDKGKGAKFTFIIPIKSGG